MVVYTLNDVELIFDVAYTSEQKEALQNLPFSGDVLEACTGTHMLFPSFPLSLLDIRDKHADLFHSKIGGWYAGEKHTFSRAMLPLQWHLLRTTPVPNSFGKTWNEQCKRLFQDQEVPSAATVAFATMLHFKATGQRLLENCCVRTSDVDSGGLRVHVGFFAGGFGVDYYWDDYLHDLLGLSASRKF